MFNPLLGIYICDSLGIKNGHLLSEQSNINITKLTSCMMS